MAAEVLTSKELVATIRQDQGEAVYDLGRVGVVPELAIIRTKLDDGAIDTYLRSKQRHAAAIGAGFLELPIGDEDAALHEIERLNERERVHGIVVQTPLGNRSRESELFDAVAEGKDVDALGKGRGLFTPPTSLAAVELARHFTNGFEGVEPDRIAVVGALGHLVGSGAVQLLRAEEFEPHEIDARLYETEDELEAELATLGTRFDVILTATGQPMSITPAHLKRPRGAELPLTVVDAGIGMARLPDGTTAPHQDLHPDVFNLSYVRATQRMNAVGPMAVAFMFGNVVDAAQTQWAREELKLA